MTRDELHAWIEDLRGRFDAGEFNRDVRLMCRVGLLLDLVTWWQSRPEDERATVVSAIEQRQRLAEELAALHERLVEGKPCAPPDWSPMGPPRD